MELKNSLLFVKRINIGNIFGIVTKRKFAKGSTTLTVAPGQISITGVVIRQKELPAPTKLISGSP